MRKDLVERPRYLISEKNAVRRDIEILTDFTPFKKGIGTMIEGIDDLIKNGWKKVKMAML